MASDLGENCNRHLPINVGGLYWHPLIDHNSEQVEDAGASLHCFRHRHDRTYSQKTIPTSTFPAVPSSSTGTVTDAEPPGPS